MKFDDCISCRNQNSDTCVACIKAGKYQANFEDLCYICRISNSILTPSKATREILCKYCEGKNSNFKEINAYDIEVLENRTKIKERTIEKCLQIN